MRGKKKKKKKKCELCQKHDHVMGDCPDFFEHCTKGDVCKYFCMADLCTKFLKLMKRLHKASSREKLHVAKEKLDDLECLLDDALEYLSEHKGRKLKSCSTKKGMRCLQKACTYLEEKYEDRFDLDESSSDDEEEWSYPMGVPVIEKKGVKEGVSQGSHQNPIQAPKPTLGFNHNEVNLQSRNLIEMCDPYNVCVDRRECVSEKQHFELLAINKNQAEVPSGVFGYSDFQKSVLFGSFFHIAMQGERKKQTEAKTVDLKVDMSEDQATLFEYTKVYSEGIEVSKYLEALMELQRSENDQESVHLGENVSNMVVLQKKSCFCDDSKEEHEESDVFQDDSILYEVIMQFQETEYDSKSAQSDIDFSNLMFLQSEFEEEDNVIEDFLFPIHEKNVLEAKMKQKLSFAQSEVEGFLDPIVQNQMVDLKSLILSNVISMKGWKCLQSAG